METKHVKIGIAGFGTVGSGVAKIILEQADSIALKTGVRLQLACVVDLDTKSKRPVELPDGILTNDISRLLDDDTISIAVELIGGTSAAKDIQIKMLQSGKNVVTANKALLAKHGKELYGQAHKAEKCIAFEASCAGGIPIISGLRSGLIANNISQIYGIVNGTCNYILSSMAQKNEQFSEALSQAKKKGFAESDPTLDINGSDSAHKLVIMASLAFGYEFKLEDVYIEGIENISQDEIQFGNEMGYVLKLLAIAEKNENGTISLRVHPSFIPHDNPLANVSGSFNAVSIFGSAVGQVMYFGRGAGMMPTASAIVADIIDTAIGNSATTFRHINIRPRDQIESSIEKIDNLAGRFYIRLMVKDQFGVFAQIGQVLSDNEISISGLLQKEGRGPENTVPVVITTHITQQNKVSRSLKQLNDLDVACSKPVCIRIVDIPEDKD